MYAGVWKTAEHSGHLQHMCSINHVHAHLTAAQRENLTSEQLLVAELNEVADAAAKKRARELQVDASLRAEYRNKVAESRTVIKTIAATLGQFPRPERLARTPPLLTSEQKQAVRRKQKADKMLHKQSVAVALRTHAWEQAGRCLWRCVRCLDQRWVLHEPARTFDCSVTPALEAVRWSTAPTEHDLWATQIAWPLQAGLASHKPVLVWCRRCWCYSSTRLLNLKQAFCNDRLNNRAIYNRSRILRGRHPTTDAVFSHHGAVRVERQFDFRSKLQHDKGMVIQPGTADIFPDHRSEDSYAMNPPFVAPDSEGEECAVTAQQSQALEADLRLLAADGFGSVV